ncbi:MAG: T9SS type A sorting domain-containing protein, partial [Bacteroidota bacterium]
LRQGEPLFWQFSEATESIDVMEITVRSMQGQSVYQNRVMDAQALQTIATEKLSPGIYTLEARTGRWSKAIKIIVQ